MQVKKKPERQCVGCRECKEKRKLIRIVKTAEGDYKLDSTGRQNGRGAYLCNSPECLAKARKTNALSRSFHTNVPSEIYDELERQMEHDK